MSLPTLGLMLASRAWVTIEGTDVLTMDPANSWVDTNHTTPKKDLEMDGGINATGTIRVEACSVANPVGSIIQRE